MLLTLKSGSGEYKLLKVREVSGIFYFFGSFEFIGFKFLMLSMPGIKRSVYFFYLSSVNLFNLFMTYSCKNCSCCFGWNIEPVLAIPGGKPAYMDPLILCLLCWLEKLYEFEMITMLFEN